MPRRVNGTERREMFAEAVWRVAADRGLEGTSMSAIAAEAGTSVGLIQHYFTGRDELVAFAAARLRERAERRMAAVAADAGPSPLRRLRAMLVEVVVPGGAPEVGPLLVEVALLSRALRDPGMGETYRAGHGRTVAAVAALLEDAATAGEIRRSGEPELDARLLLAVVAGTATDLALGRVTPDVATALVDRQLGHLGRPVGSDPGADRINATVDRTPGDPHSGQV